MIQALRGKVPSNSLNYCVSLWESHKFNFRITGKRKTKIGDYRFDPGLGLHSISVNEDLNPYAFLITYIHEVAHLWVRLRYSRRVNPHGREWKLTFQRLMNPLLRKEVFPEDLLPFIVQHMNDPKATVFSDVRLTEALMRYNSCQRMQTVHDVPIEKPFSLNGRTFIKLSEKRTRWLCKELETGRRFYISRMAEVNT